MDQLSSRIDINVLRQVAPYAPSKKVGAQATILRSLSMVLPELLASISIDTSLRISHFLAQICHESDGFCAIEEYASGQDYEGRADLGNTKPGDGVRYKGRSPLQLTGRGNYRAFTAWMRKRNPGCPDFEAEPALVATWPWAGWAMIYFWDVKKLNAVADRDDLVALTRVINGGKNGLADRAACLTRAKLAVGNLAGNMQTAQQGSIALVRGMSGDAVEWLQRALQASGYYLLSIDGQFGAGTEAALKAFQRANGLTVDGIAGRDTRAALLTYASEAKP
ncbi:peptidoglycan-binding protein [Agrobacterium vitis]|uniref:peptidoglycan-binding protein n=1 Tax=Agrobacterium vitis TaxID=373 RepID=UPI001F210722|nr:peptidoglycan-binding protein [Agrobacterium vitis]